MILRKSGFALKLTVWSVRAIGQQNVTTSGGTSGMLPVFTSSSNVENSIVNQTGNTVTVNGFVYAATSYGGSFFTAHQLGAGSAIQGASMFSATTDNPSGWQNTYFQGVTAGTVNFSVRADGLAFFGNTMQTNGGVWVNGQSTNISSGLKGVYLWGANYDSAKYQNAGVGGSVNYNGTTYLVGTDGGSNGGWLIRGTEAGDDFGFYTIPGANPGNVPQSISPGAMESYRRMTITNAGSVGIGTTSPQATLDVSGNVKISGSGAPLMFPDGTTQSTAYSGTCVATGGDYAESVDVKGPKASYEPGDVMVIGTESTSDVTKSSEPYSTLVAGIYSSKPGYVGRRQTTNPQLATSEIPMAMIGNVPTKVSTENGSIHRGDLLVSSSTPAYAMKGTDHNRMAGAILGKAMGSLDSGSGLIDVLVTLQ